MERKILDDLLKWKNSPYRKPLILKGVRQVGKTWILKEFGRRYYENTAYFNFDENEDYTSAYEGRNQAMLENHVKILDLQESLKKYF